MYSPPATFETKSPGPSYNHQHRLRIQVRCVIGPLCIQHVCRVVIIGCHLPSDAVIVTSEIHYAPVTQRSLSTYQLLCLSLACNDQPHPRDRPQCEGMHWTPTQCNTSPHLFGWLDVTRLDLIRAAVEYSFCNDGLMSKNRSDKRIHFRCMN